jgi:hypothetical protein
MQPNSYLLLQNEGALMQGCFKSALTGLRAATSGERGPFYAGFFNYAIGLEEARQAAKQALAEAG